MPYVPLLYVIMLMVIVNPIHELANAPYKKERVTFLPFYEWVIKVCPDGSTATLPELSKSLPL